MSSTASLSIIIPTLNEAEALPALLTQLAAQQDIELDVIVADGGSGDNTCELAEAANATVIKTAAGRGTQMNAGAALAQHDTLLFLHADSAFTSDSQLSQAMLALQHEIDTHSHNRIAGHFALSFAHDDDPEKFAYRYAAAKTHLNRVNTTNGDQGFLLRKGFFMQLGGFDESMGFLEDQRLAETIRVQGQWFTLPGLLITSARRFETEGFARRYTIMAVIMAAHMTDMHEFFRMAPPLYQAQSETGKLLVSRYGKIIMPMIWQASPRRRWQQILKYGQYVKDNWWQLFFVWDVRRHKAGEPVNPRWMNFHDRYVKPLVQFKIFDAAVGISIIIWFAGILRAYYTVKDWRDLQELEAAETASNKNPNNTDKNTNNNTDDNTD